MSNMQFNSSYKGREIEEAVKRANEIIPNQIKDLNAKTEVLSKQKADIKSVPKRVSQLENDSNFVTKNDVKKMVDDINSNLDNIDNINIIATEGVNSIVQKIEGTTSTTQEIVFEEYPRAGESFDFEFNMIEDIDTANVVVNVYGNINDNDGGWSEMAFGIELNDQKSPEIEINTLLSSEYIQLSNVKSVNKGKNTLYIVPANGTLEGTQIPIQKIVIRGKQSNVTGEHSSALGRYHTVKGEHSTAVGYDNIIEADNAFAAGSSNIIGVQGKGSFIAGHNNESPGTYQFVAGTYSDVDAKDAFVIGNGQHNYETGEDEFRNAFRVDKEGNAFITKDIRVGGHSTVVGDDSIEGNQEVKGNSNVKGNQLIEGNTTTKGNTVIEGTLDVSGDVFFNHILNVKNLINTKYLALEGARAAIEKYRANTLDFISLQPNHYQTFSQNTIEQVIHTIRLGIVPDTWKVGDELVCNIAGKDRTLVIIGKNADKFVDGTVAPFTFHFKELYSDWYAPMYESGVTNNGWEFSTMRTKTLPNILSQFPQILRDSIDPVVKYTEGSDGKTQTTEDKLFLLAFPELSTCPSNNVDYCPEIPSAIYPTVYSTNPLRAKYIYPNDNITDEDNKTLAPWLMRNADGSSNFRCIAPDLNNNGQYSTRAPIGANTDIYFAPAFCISNKFALHIGDTILDEDIVKKMYARTEYATADKAGVVKVNSWLGQSGLSITEDGQLSIFEADPVDIDSYQPKAVITSSNVGYAVEKHGSELYSNAIKKTITAQDMVFIKDISPLRHTVKVRVSSDIVTDLTKIKIDVLDKGAGIVGRYIPSSDGTVEIPSISPEMGIVPYSGEVDPSEITVDVEYIQDINAFVKDINVDLKELDSDFNRRTNEIEAIAKGRATGYVFDTVEDLDSWLEDEANVSKLKLGDNLYIRAKEVPDYWWDGNSKQQLETQKVDLAEYIKNTDYATADKAGVVKVNGDIWESALYLLPDGTLHLLEATNVDFGCNYPAVITVRNLGEAVKYVCDGYYATAEQLGDISSALDRILAIQETIVGGVN